MVCGPEAGPCAGYRPLARHLAVLEDSTSLRLSFRSGMARPIAINLDWGVFAGRHCDVRRFLS
jgi:hypothetical protein